MGRANGWVNGWLSHQQHVRSTMQKQKTLKIYILGFFPDLTLNRSMSSQWYCHCRSLSDSLRWTVLSGKLKREMVMLFAPLSLESEVFLCQSKDPGWQCYQSEQECVYVCVCPYMWHCPLRWREHQIARKVAWVSGQSQLCENLGKCFLL